MAAETFKKEDFQSFVEEKFDESLANLKEEMGFTVEGLAKRFETHSEVLLPFFSNIIGGDFDSANDAHMTELLDKAYTDKNVLADCMFFMYDHFKDEEDGAPVETKEPKAKKSKGRGRKKKDWSGCEIPFAEGTRMHFVYSELSKFSGSKKEFYAHLRPLFEAKGWKTITINPMTYNVIGDVKNRIGTIITEVGGKIIVSTGPTDGE